MAEPKIRVGVGGWTYEPWRGVFYPAGTPQKSELAYASRHLSSIEVNGTFYGSQSPETFQKWHDETPDDFVFTLKGPRFATNRKVLSEGKDSVNRFLDGGVRNLKEKLGPINWQFATTKKFDVADFEQFLKLLPTDLRHAVEVRHESFKCKEFVSLLRQYGVAVVLAGDSAHPLIPDVTAPFVYARIMGTVEGEENGYSAADLDGWAGRAKAFASGKAPQDLPAISDEPAEVVGRDVFLYVISGFKQVNPLTATELMKLL